MSTFIEHLKHYIAERRHYGCDWSAAEWNLRPFAASADAEGAEWLTVGVFLRWKVQDGSASSITWNSRLSAVRGFTAWLKARDQRTKVPPKGLVPKRYQRPAPCIYSDDEIVRIVTEAAKPPSPRGLKGKTLATLFGLLAATGLRTGEALGLDDLDVDLDDALLHIPSVSGRRADRRTWSRGRRTGG